MTDPVHAIPCRRFSTPAGDVPACRSDCDCIAPAPLRHAAYYVELDQSALPPARFTVEELCAALGVPAATFAAANRSLGSALANLFSPRLDAFRLEYVTPPFAHPDAVRERLSGLVERNATREKVTVRRADLARLLRNTAQQPATDATAENFVVVAGRWDDGERNTKLISEPMTLDAALDEYAGCAGYPWRHIEYKGVCLDVLESGQ